MVTANGAKVIEFNVRLGDPEAQVILPLIDEPLLPLLVAAATGRLVQSAVRLGSERLGGVVPAGARYPRSSSPRQPLAAIDAGWAVPALPRPPSGAATTG